MAFRKIQGVWWPILRKAVKIEKKKPIYTLNNLLNPVVPYKRTRNHSMNTKLLMIIALLFFLSWRRAADSFLLFCALFAIALFVCVLIYRMENTHSVVDDDT